MTIDIPEAVLREAIRHTGAKTKRDAVMTAVNEFNRRRRLAAMAERLHGACPDFMAQEDLRHIRKDRMWGSFAVPTGKPLPTGITKKRVKFHGAQNKSKQRR